MYFLLVVKMMIVCCWQCLHTCPLWGNICTNKSR